MKTRITKRIIHVLLLINALSVFTFFYGCESMENKSEEKINSTSSEGSPMEVLEICIDSQIDPSVMESSFLESMELVPGYQEDFTVSVSSLPGDVVLSEQDLNNRENALVRIKTEIMAGGGPDLFICVCPRPSYGTERTNRKGLFPYPESAMESNLFLDLSAVISQSKLIEWDNLVPQIMDVGKYKENQFILPLTYTFGITGFERNLHKMASVSPMTRFDQLNSKNGSIRQAGHTDEIFSVFGRIADYENDILTFTENDLLTCIKDYWKPLDLSEDEFPDTPAGLMVGLPNMLNDKGKMRFGQNSPEYIFIPQYNTISGVTAYITSFIAVNRNTQYPKEALAIIEILMSKEGQQNAPLYGDLYGMPTHMEVGSEDSPAYSSYGSWYMNDANFNEFCKLRGQINAVNFFTPLEAEIDKMLWTCYETELIDVEIEELVSDSYRVMTMMIGES